MSELTSPATTAHAAPPVTGFDDRHPRARREPRGAWFGAIVVIVILAIGTVGLLLGRSTRAGAAGTITVTGSGIVQGVPDTLQFSVGVDTIGLTATDALTANDARMRGLEATLFRYGVTKKDVQTSNLNIYENTNSQGQLTGFTVSDTLSVTIHHVNLPGHLNKAGAAIEGAARSVGNGIQFNGITFSITNQSTLLAVARTRAMHDAYAQAHQDASAGNASIGRIVRIVDEVQNQSQPVTFGFDTIAARSGVPLLSGTQPVSVQVTVVYALN